MKSKTPKQIAVKIRSLKRQVSRLEKQKKRSAKRPKKKGAAKKRKRR